MIYRDGEDWVLDCHIQPRAKRDQILGEHNGAVKIRIQAPPADGAANKALVALLAKEFAVSKSRVVIEHGAGGRRKRVRVHAAGALPANLAELTSGRDH